MILETINFDFAILLATALIGFGLLIFLVFSIKLVRPTLSKIYRKYLTDLYVSARIRQLAKKDNLNLEEEEKNFLTYSSRSANSRIRELDNKIEQDLMSRTNETYEKGK